VVSEVVANGAPMDAPQQFGGAPSSALSPSVVYPPDAVLLPPNLSELEIQFSRPQGTTLFELSFQSKYLDLKVYTPCVQVGAGCGYLPDDPTWSLLSTQARGEPVALTVRATSGPGGQVGQSTTRTLSFSDEDLTGGLYYWAAASGGIARYDFGRRGQKAEQFYTASQAGATCAGCHSLSHDGKRIAVGLNIPGPAQLRVLDVATRSKLFESAGGPGGIGGIGGIGGGGGSSPTGNGSNFVALSPDSSKLLATEGTDLVLRDAASGALLSTAVQNGSMPDWSPSGALVVFARQTGGGAPCFLGLCGSNPGVDSAALYLSDVTGGSNFSAPRLLVQGAGGTNNYYPTISPDGSVVAFNRSTMNSYDAPDARLMAVSTSGSAQPADLALANVAVGNSWPKFAPFVSHFGGKTIFWLTFSSRRDYGYRIANSGVPKDDQIAQLWMVAVSPDDVAQGGGGFPAFWLPFQDPSTGNHIAQWTETVARQPCGTGTEGCPSGEQCVNGECVGIPIN
jgi:Tol biopolymer transport system component